MRRTRTLLATGSLIALALTLGACAGAEAPSQRDPDSSAGAAGATGPGADQVAEWYEAAKDEEPIRFYTSQPPSSMDSAIAAFREAYPGVDIEGLRLSSGNLVTRYTQEIEAGSRTADVISVGNTLFTRDGLEKGYFETFERDEIPAAAELEDRWFDQGVATVLVNPYGICYNSQAVSTPPEAWDDVLDPRFQGRIVFPDFRNASVYVYAGQHFADAYGEQLLEDLAALDPISADSMIPGLQSVANGQADIGLVCGVNTAEELVAAGAPIEVVMPDDAIAIPDEMAITAGTPSPNAARLFYDFMLTEAGQEAFVGTATSSPIGSEGSIPLGEDFVFPDFDRYQESFDTLARYF
ncbi:extracellular solute-binding protein [Cnuibacter physcomitrellae]|uniref:ABC transporter substrate-binding protein n=1 Tax=Cnuibacter physcomitrellae TaxID=1619308 RepID=UPI002175CF0D|nr:extracellular solute-binding protein [Cnuibacter physcomitrellae]MCS5498256.1 extracellular solute-binding protein [Cnuibacter physcomitrellae]